jgi:hypothetical protein
VTVPLIMIKTPVHNAQRSLCYTPKEQAHPSFYVSEMQKSIAEVFGQAGIFRLNVNAVCIEEQPLESGLAVRMV